MVGGRPTLLQHPLFPIPPSVIPHRLALMDSSRTNNNNPCSIIQLASDKSAFHRVVPRIRNVDPLPSSSSEGMVSSVGESQLSLEAAAPNPPLHIGNILQEVTAQILFSTIRRLRINQFYMR